MIPNQPLLQLQTYTYTYMDNNNNNNNNPSNSWLDTSLDLNAKPLIHQLGHDRHQPSAHLPSASMKQPIADDLEEEVERVRAENRKLTEMLTEMCESYNGLRKQLIDHLNNNNNKSNSEDDPSSSSKRRRSDQNPELNNNNNNNNLGLLSMGVSESSTTEEDSAKKEDHSTAIRAKVSTVCVRTQVSDNSTNLVVKDGYQWRKYGQKVTRDNPCPRAYFKCSFAPSCPVKKKVQRSAEDQSMVVATYEGEHNHPPPSSTSPMDGQPSSSSPGRCNVARTARPNSANIEVDAKRVKVDQAPKVRQYLVEQMASSLTRDPNFTAALAAAISGKMFPTSK